MLDTISDSSMKFLEDISLFRRCNEAVGSYCYKDAAHMLGVSRKTLSEYINEKSSLSKEISKENSGLSLCPNCKCTENLKG